MSKFSSDDNSWTREMLRSGNREAVKQRALDEPQYVFQRDQFQDAPLHIAIDTGDIDIVRFLLSHGANPNELDGGQITCLTLAIDCHEQSNLLPIISDLLKAGANIHTPGFNGWSPIQMAAQRGMVELARLLIANGADVNQKKYVDGGDTPLMEAAAAGRAEMVKLLVNSGADASIKNDFGFCALDYASEQLKKLDDHCDLQIVESIEQTRAKGDDVASHFKKDYRDIIQLLHKP